MKRLWKKVTPIPIEFNGHGYLWDCTKCGYCLTSWEKYPKCDCPRCGATEHMKGADGKRGRAMKHELKILPKYFEAVNCGKKNFEIRINDRNYQEDDELILKEWERGKYTGRECRRWVGYIYHGDGTYGIAENTVIMALKRSAPTACLDNDTADRKTEPQKKYPTEWCEECDLWRDNNCMGVAQCKRNIQILTEAYKAEQTEREGE